MRTCSGVPSGAQTTDSQHVSANCWALYRSLSVRWMGGAFGVPFHLDPADFDLAGVFVDNTMRVNVKADFL